MKKLIAYILVFAQMFWTCAPAVADPLDDALKAAENLRDTLRDNFGPYVRSVVQYGIKTQYVLLDWDHAQAQKILAERAAAGMNRLNELRTQFDNAESSLFSAPDQWDQNAVHAFALIGEAQSLAITAAQIQVDGEALKKSWLQQCQAARLTRTQGLNDPLAYMNLIGVPGATGINPNFEIGVQVSTDFTGKSNPEGNASMSGNDTDAAIVDTGIALFYCGPWGILAGIIILACWAIYKLGSYFHQIAENARREGLILDRQQEIYDIQIGALRAISGEVPAIVSDACTQAFPEADADKMQLQIYADFAQRTHDTLKDLQERKQKILLAFADRYRNLAAIYFPQVAKNYVNLVNARFAQAAEMDSLIHRIVANVLAPLMKDYQMIKDKGVVNKWRAQQDIWSVQIQADAQFRTDSAYSFLDLNEPQAPAHFSNFWNDLGPKLNGVMQ